MLKTYLHICPTRERARDAARLYDGDGFCDAVTLPRFIDDAFARLMPGAPAFSGDDALLMLMDVAGTTRLTHFKRLGENPEDVLLTASSMVDLFHLVKANGGKDLIHRLGHNDAKTADLTALYEAFEAEKRTRAIMDAPSRARIVADRIGDAVGDRRVILDAFEMQNVHLWGSSAERGVLGALAALSNSEAAPAPPPASPPRITHQRAVTRTDEVEKAALIVKSLLLDGVKPADMVIAAGQVSHYIHILPSVFARHGIPVFLSRGIPVRQTPAWRVAESALARTGTLAAADAALGAYLSRLGGLDDMPGMENDRAIAKAAAGKLRSTITNLMESGRPFTRPLAMLEHLVESMTVFAPAPGIRVQELNQLVFRRIPHVVLIGADDACLPKRPPSSMLVTGRQLESVFQQNNSHDLSAMHVHALMDAAEYLHVVSASVDNRRPVEPSLLLMDAVGDVAAYPAHPIRDDAFDAVSLLGQPDTHARTRIDDVGELFITAAASAERTPFDGVLPDAPPKLPHYLSASAVRDYVSCPLKYLYGRLLNLRAPADEADGFDVMQAGSLMHLVFERFTRHVKENPGTMEKTLSPNTKKLMHRIASDAFTDFLADQYGNDADKRKNIHHTATLDDITAGLMDDNEPGLALKFLHDISARFGGRTFAERVFAVEHAIDPETCTISGVPIRGAIDRIDITNEEIRLIDYKSKRKKRDAAVKEANTAITDLTDVQLLLYLDYAKNHLPSAGKSLIATLTSYHYGEKPDFAHVTLHDDDSVTLLDKNGKTVAAGAVMEEMRKIIKQTWDGVHAGAFGFTPSDEACAYCAVAALCHKDSRTKETEVHDDGGEE